MAYNTTSVLILNDFQIRSLPTIPSAFLTRIDDAVWKEFTDECVKRVNHTYSQNNDMTNLGSKRCWLRVAYIICAPLVFILGYSAYYCLVLGSAFGVGVLFAGAILAIAAFAAFVCAAVSVAKCGSLMKGYRFASQQDLDGIFSYMNARYNNLIYFSSARSTHRNNGTVQLGINIVLRVQQLSTSMAAMTGTNTGNVAVGVMPVQVHGVPIQLANGQIVYQVAAPQQQQQQIRPIQQMQPQPMAIQTQQQISQQLPEYQPPPGVNPQYQAMNQNEGEGNVNNNNNYGNTGHGAHYQ